MSITRADILLIAPELSSLPTGQVDAAITASAFFINRTTWGNKSDIAQTYLAAHLLTIGNLGGSLGGASVASEKVGDLAVTYAVPVISGGLFGSTSYGSHFQWMMKSLVITPLVVN